ncbi:MAG: TIGR03862 family flavoprotein [Hylemonella sp.]
MKNIAIESAADAGQPSVLRVRAAVIGGGPAGLMAAEVLAEGGVAVDLFDAMPSVGRKFLLAGRGGLNLTHSEPLERFAARYGQRRQQIEPLLRDFGATQLREWARGLGIDTFVGTSGRVFPADMKAAPLLRAWLQRLRHPPGGGPGLRLHMRHRWVGWAADGRTLRFETPQGPLQVRADAVVLALGGGSWARLGSNGAWVPLLAARGVAVAPLLPANCGFDVAVGRHMPAPGQPLPVAAVQPPVGWSAHFASRWAGQPFKTVAIACADALGRRFERKGEFVATVTGVEGSLIYAASALLRDEILRCGHALLQLDLLPDWSAERVRAAVLHPRGSRSLSSHLKSRLGLDGIKTAVLYEVLGTHGMKDLEAVARAIKALPLHLVAARPIDEAISSAGGVLFEALTPNLECEALPGVFCAGEMLDWEAPTGGYLLTACLASGWRAGHGALIHINSMAPTAT